MTGNKLDSLTGLRAMAAFAVLIAHAVHWTSGGNLELGEFCKRLAYFGMSLFFVLSGFVIEYNYGKSLATGRPGQIWKFFVARFARLYPLYIVILLLSIVLAGRALNWGDPITWAYLSLTQSWFNWEEAFYPPAWSISTECFFYLVFVLIAWPLSKIRWPVTAAIIVLLLVAGLLALMFIRKPFALWHVYNVGGEAVHIPKVSADPWYWLTYYAPFVRFGEFLLGVMLAKAYSAGVKVPAWLGYLGLTWCVGVLAFGGIANGTFFADYLPNFVYAPGIALGLMLACRESLFAGALSFKPAVFLGEISYSVYLLQELLWPHTARITQDPLPRIFVFIAATVAVSVATYYLIEAPGRFAIRRGFGWLFKRKPRPVEATA